MAAVTEPWLSDGSIQTLLDYLHFASPIILFLVFLVAFVAHSVATASGTETIPLQQDQTGPGGKPLPRTTSPVAKAKAKSKTLDFSPSRKLLFVLLSITLIATFVGNAILVIAHALTQRRENWWCGQAVVVYLVASVFVYSLVLISIVDTKPSPTSVHVVTWAVGLVLEAIITGAAVSFYTSKHREPKAFDPHGGKFRRGITTWEGFELAADLLRLVSLGALVAFYTLFLMLRWRKLRGERHSENGNIDETTRLLRDHRKLGSANGDAHISEVTKKQPEEPSGWVRPDKLPSKTWWEYVRGYSLFFPYLWPTRSLQLQTTFFLCIILVASQRVINVLVPIQAGRITDDLANENGQTPGIPWLGICLYIIYRLLQGTSGLLNALRASLWIPISQYSYRELSVASFEHVHGLSLEFHLGKKTGEVLSALSKGSSINNFLESVTFSVLPMLVDLAVAIGYFLVAFDAYYALIVTLVSFSYMYLTIRLAQWRAEMRRDMVNLSRTEDAVKNDSMMSYETVKYFNAERYEFERYRGSVNNFQRAEYGLLVSLNLMNIAQNVCFTIALMGSCILCAFQITIGQRHVGKFVVLLTYMAQLQTPLNYFGTFYRSIQSSMINSERMLELFKERPTVIDSPSSAQLPSCQGDIQFSDVKFSYDPRKPALDGLNFHCAPGTTTALVGESGGGKSTVFRLIFRFYNILQGKMQVDGHDVQDITIDSLRRHIGVVPQDTVLFNETLMYNLKYAKPSATDEEVCEACRAASIHEKILGFPDGYQTRVGERGLKLSGGEKQRVAIARTILKDPRIILLDEATAALDTETEQHIQTALDKLSQGRTTLVIAHRLSTITTADQILVLHAGKVAERGTHEQLLELKGRYASMWRKQIRAQKAAEQAKVATDRAKQLRHEAQGDESTTTSDDERLGANQRGRTPAALSMSGACEVDAGISPGHP